MVPSATRLRKDKGGQAVRTLNLDKRRQLQEIAAQLSSLVPKVRTKESAFHNKLQSEGAWSDACKILGPIFGESPENWVYDVWWAFTFAKLFSSYTGKGDGKKLTEPTVALQAVKEEMGIKSGFNARLSRLDISNMVGIFVEQALEADAYLVSASVFHQAVNGSSSHAQIFSKGFNKPRYDRDYDSKRDKDSGTPNFEDWSEDETIAYIKKARKQVAELPVEIEDVVGQETKADSGGPEASPQGEGDGGMQISPLRALGGSDQLPEESQQDTADDGRESNGQD